MSAKVLVNMVMLLTLPCLVVAAGSRIANTTLLNDSYNRQTINISSSGNNNLVSTGSIVVRNSTVNNSHFINLSRNTNTVTMAVGNNKLAATGSILVLNKNVSGMHVVNASQNKDTKAIADDSSNGALIGSINIFE